MMTQTGEIREILEFTPREIKIFSKENSNKIEKKKERRPGSK